jgi:acyl carrier protein
MECLSGSAGTVEIERVIAEIWAEFIPADESSGEQSLFAMGGDSLVATQILARIETRFGVTIDLESVFPEFTVRTLAELVDQSLVALIDAMDEEEVERRLAELQDV